MLNGNNGTVTDEHDGNVMTVIMHGSKYHSVRTASSVFRAGGEAHKEAFELQDMHEDCPQRPLPRQPVDLDHIELPRGYLQGNDAFEEDEYRSACPIAPDRCPFCNASA